MVIRLFNAMLANCGFLMSARSYRRMIMNNWVHIDFDIVSKYNVGLKTLLMQGLSEPELYGDFVYKFRNIIGKNDFPYHFKR